MIEKIIEQLEKGPYNIGELADILLPNKIKRKAKRKIIYKINKHITIDRKKLSIPPTTALRI